jgi:hypothetical protein
VQRQWDSVSHFRPQIIQKATSFLAMGQSDSSLTETLLAIMILDNATSKQVLDRLLNVRKASIVHGLTVDDSTSLSDRLCNIVAGITVTIKQVASIFLAGEERETCCIDEYIKFMGSKADDLGALNSIASLYSEKTNIHVIFRYLPLSIQVCYFDN